MLDAKLTVPEKSKVSCRLEIRAIFRPFPVEKGMIIKTECYIACQGAHFEIKIVDAEISDFKGNEWIQTQYHEETSAERTASIKGSILGRGFSEGGGSKVNHDGREAILSALRDEKENTLHWTYKLPSGIKAVRDYLEGNYDDIWAEVKWTEVKTPSFSLKAWPTDRHFFGQNGLKLSRLASLALTIKLSSYGIDLPSMNPRKYVVRPRKQHT